HDAYAAALAKFGESTGEHYSRLGERVKPHRGMLDARLPQRPLEPEERAELVAFLMSLTDESFVQRFAGGSRGEAQNGDEPQNGDSAGLAVPPGS
ncbi:MAG: hypothetical protein ACTHL7_11640, partial [Steroidobacteraceae bacterium]